MSLFTAFQKWRTERRRMYYWAGTFACVVGVLLLTYIVLSKVMQNQGVVPNFIAGYCAIFATLLSFFQILEHLTCFSDPECQTKIVRILFMVPLFALISWISLLAPGVAEYLNLIRDTYESYVIYAFFQLMMALMGGIDTVYRTLMIEDRPPVRQVFPFCYLEPIRVTPTFVQNCRLCLFQFMLLKPLITIIVVILSAYDAMGTSMFDVTKGTFWTYLVYNISITVAFTALLYFYVGLKDLMEGRNALLKFLCVKAVVFLSFWQGLLIQVISAAGLLPTFSYWKAEDTPTALQDLLICVEMMLIAFAHKYCFGSDEYMINNGSDDCVIEDVSSQDGLQPRTIPPIRYSVVENLKYTLKHEDILMDMRDIVHNR
ncbi:f2o10.10 protein-like protein [Novymonas esmeraldas]|uniref:F2o10.10 protein-like protein n=1 Tax=Novymonas esmeraldas TaxID=1808958 RepID=A0AAW0FA11_9TRYP